MHDSIGWYPLKLKPQSRLFLNSIPCYFNLKCTYISNIAHGYRVNVSLRRILPFKTLSLLKSVDCNYKSSKQSWEDPGSSQCLDDHPHFFFFFKFFFLDILIVTMYSFIG